MQNTVKLYSSPSLNFGYLATLDFADCGANLVEGWVGLFKAVLVLMMTPSAA